MEDVISKQAAMQQNFIKMVDKNINDMEADTKFLDKAHEEYRKEDPEAPND